MRITRIIHFKVPGCIGQGSTFSGLILGISQEGLAMDFRACGV